MDLKLLNEWEKIERQQHNSHWFVHFKCSDDEIESRWKICWIFYCRCLFSSKIRESIAELVKRTAIRGFTKLQQQCKANGIQNSQCIPFILCNQLFIACSQQSSRQLLYIVDRKIVSFVDFVSNYKPSSPKWMSCLLNVNCNVCFHLNAIRKRELSSTSISFTLYMQFHWVTNVIFPKAKCIFYGFFSRNVLNHVEPSQCVYINHWNSICNVFTFLFHSFSIFTGLII